MTAVTSHVEKSIYSAVAWKGPIYFLIEFV